LLQYVKEEHEKNIGRLMSKKKKSLSQGDPSPKKEATKATISHNPDPDTTPEVPASSPKYFLKSQPETEVKSQPNKKQKAAVNIQASINSQQDLIQEWSLSEPKTTQLQPPPAECMEVSSEEETSSGESSSTDSEDDIYFPAPLPMGSNSQEIQEDGSGRSLYSYSHHGTKVQN